MKNASKKMKNSRYAEVHADDLTAVILMITKEALSSLSDPLGTGLGSGLGFAPKLVGSVSTEQAWLDHIPIYLL